MDTPTSSRALRIVALSIAWTLAWLVLFDIATHFVIARLAARHPDSGVVRYFQYGLSVEAKLDEATRLPTGAPDALILDAGWLDPAQWQALPTAPAPGSDKLVALYGQSFAFNVAREVMRMDGRLTLRRIGGPAAPPDHSYTAYLKDGGNAHADIVLFGILASAVPHMGAMSGMDWTFEHPAPFTYPRYTLREGRLEAEAPVLGTQRQFRDAFAVRSGTWDAFKAQLARNDRGFDPLTFDRTWLDGSQIALLMRRGWVAHSQDYAAGIYDPRTGFAPDAEQIRVLNAMLVDLGQRTKRRGQRLIVLLEQDQGYGSALYKALGPTLERERIEFISTHTLFSSGDPHNFQPDGHYTEAANAIFARQLETMIRTPQPAS